MNDIGRGPLQTYELIWKTGHVERIQAHQVLLPMPTLDLFGGPGVRDTRVTFHGEIDGRWLLLLDASYEDVASIRLVTSDEPVPGSNA